MFAVFQPNGPEADPRPWSEIRALRGIEAIEDAVDAAMLKIEPAIDAVAVTIDSYDCCLETDRKLAVDLCKEAVREMAAQALKRLEASR